MNKKSFLPLILILAVGVFFSFRLIADKNQLDVSSNNTEVNIVPYSLPENETSSKNQVIQQTIMQVLKDGHYSPKEIDDDFSKRVFSKYMEMTDFGKLFFIQSDIDEFKNFETKIDNEIMDGSTKLYDLVSTRIVQRMKEAETYYKEALEKPLTFNDNDEIELDGKKLNWCNDQAELKARWMKSIKYRTLARYTELKEQQKVTKDKKEKEKSDAQLEIDSRENVKKSMVFYFKRINKISDSDRFATYVNSICHVVDPHTDFFPPKDKQRFDEEMSGSFFGIGAQLQSEEGSCKIKQVITGTPAWKDGRMKVEDIILKVAQGDEEPVDIAGWDIEDIVQIIRGKEGSEVRLTVKHLAGNQEVISLRRGKVETESTFAKSAIIKNNGVSIGYILLPEFYAAFNDRNGRRCAEDMAKEIEKLKAENVNGIIVDLRNNGGGSLTDVVEIGGMFIDKGPIVQVKSRDAMAQSLNDKAPGLLYDGPLAILINQGSASASEILAAAMQDYKRAIIIGSTSFGKGTVQRVFGLEDFYRGEENLKPQGSIKLTLQKFYRVNGGSTQLKGVTPDIKLPDAFELIDIGERKDDNSLAWDQVAKADYKPYKQSVDFGKLVELSNKRTANNESFKIISQNAARMKQQYDENKYSLNLVKYQEQIKEAKDLSKKLEELDKVKTTTTVLNLKSDKTSIQKDTVSIRRNEEWVKALKKDAYISEATNVILDWMKLEKNNPSSTQVIKSLD
jgi:carboxyl-terminal processing protease